MSDSELSEFEPYDCLDDLAADLERYTQSQLNNDRISTWADKSSPFFNREWKDVRGFEDEKDPRGKIAIQIRPKRGSDGNSPIDKSDLKKMTLRAPSIEERMAKFDSSLHRDFKIQKKSLVSVKPAQSVTRSPPSYEDDMETIELNRKQRFRVASDAFKTTDKQEEIANNAARKSSFTSDNLGLHVVGQSRSAIHKNHESSLIDHSKEDRPDSARVSVNSSALRRLKMHSTDGGDDFPVRRKLSQGRKSLSPAVEYQQQHSRHGPSERFEGGKQTKGWLGQETDRIVHRSSGDQILDRTKNSPHFNYSTQSDLRLSSSSKVAAVIKEGIQGQGSHSVAQQLTGVNTQLPREKVRSAKGGIYFPSQLVRSQSFGEDHNITNNVTSAILQRELKNKSADAGKSPANDLSSQTERASGGIYLIKHKKRAGIVSDGRGLEASVTNSIITTRKGERVADITRSTGNKIQEQLRTDRSTHNSQRTDNPGVIYSNQKAHGSISQITENNLIKSQTSVPRVRKNSLGLLEPRKIISSSGPDRGKLVEKNNNTVWITDSASGSSEEERTIETDSSTTSSVIDERRRRRLVKRSRKRGLNTRKSQISQLLDREISAIESQTSDDGTSRASIDDNLTDILSPDEGLGKINSRESYKRARQIFEKSKPAEPQRATPKNNFIARIQDQQNVPKENVEVHTKLKEQSPPFTHTENHTAMSTVHTNRTSFTNTGIEGRNSHEAYKPHRKSSGGTFSGVAKISKITIPSLQLRSFNAPGRARYTSDTESYATHSKILSDPFGLGRRSFRDNNLGFSDGEHELTARLERSEEMFEEQAFDDHSLGFDRRCYTLPRNLGRKKMKENPFQLNLPGRRFRDVLDVQCNSQSSIEDVSVKSFPLTMKDLSPSRIQSRSAGNIGIDPMVGYGTVLENTYEPRTDNSLSMDNNFKRSLDADKNQIQAGNFTRIVSKDCSNTPSGFSPTANGVPEGITSPIETSAPSPFLVELLAPPDNFKDSPDERVSEELIEEKIEEAVESSPLIREDMKPLSMINHSIANETSKMLEKARGRPPITESTVSDKSHDRAGSPRRRPSYIKAQVSDSILWTEGEQNAEQKEVTGNRTTDEPSEMLVEEPASMIVANEEKETADQKKKRSRPRIPPTLGPVQPVFDEIVTVTSPGIEPSSPAEKSDKVKSIDSYGLRETNLAEDEHITISGEKKHEKSEIVKRRPRAILAATPMLEEIPEEKGHGSGSDTNSVRASEESRKAKKNRKQALPGDLESVELPDSPRTERSSKAETGYFSSSSTSISNQLSSLDDMMPTESPTFGVENFSDRDAFEQNRVLNLFANGTTSNELRSRSDPMRTTVANDKTSLSPPIDMQEIEPKWSSNSEPNLTSANLAPLAEPKRAISTQEVVKVEESKARKGSAESGDNLRSPVGSPFEQPAFHRPEPQKEFQPRAEVQQSPVAFVVPQPKQKHDMRRHVLQNLLDTENSYVQNLKFLETVYYKPLKKTEGGTVIESGQVDEIFFQIPEILLNHEYFLEQLNSRAKNWSDRQIIGDIFVSSFTKCLLMDAYSSFINNYLQARATVRTASLRPAFAKFLEQRCKEHKEKLTLQDLLIQPVQRIPRYVLILKDLLKHTTADHPDYGQVQLALEEIKTLAERMNKGEMEADQAEIEAEKIRDVEATIEGVSDLVTANRKYLRQDLAAEIKGVITKKDRILFLFSDLLICATVRKRTNTLRRGSLGLFSGQSATEFNRYKLLWKVPLGSTELKAPLAGDKQAERIDDDIATLRKIRSMADSLITPHPNLDMSVRELLSDLERQVSETNTMAKIELQVQTEEGPESYVFVLLSTDVRSSWEAVYEDAKQKLAYATHSFPPEFQYSLPVDKKRSGMQFTCAAPSRLASTGDVADTTGGDIWVCNSDGYVGHFCLVSMVPEAQSRPCVTVCSSRIQCIAPVPGSKLISTNKPRSTDPRKLHSINETKSHKKSSKSSKVTSSNSLKPKKSFPSESDEDDQAPGPEAIIAFDSTDEEDAGINSHFIDGPTVFGGRMSPDGSSLGTVESVEGIECSSSDEQSYHSGNESSDGEDQRIDRRIGMQIENSVRKGNQGFSQKGELDEFLSADLDENPTMWLGTQDGYIHVYQSSENVRKSKTKMLLGPVVNAILYQENKVFVALASGELRVYKRDQGNGWEVTSPQSIQIGRSGASITCIAAAAGRIWCGCQNNVVLVNASTLKIESTIVVSQDSHRSVYLIVSSGLGVWISLQSSAVVRLYHATSFENLADIDVAPAVHKMLAGADAIIRQHKAACLRITALLACKDLLWIGTSAGVILTNPLPAIKVNTVSLRNAPGPTGSPHGHTGHVRFLTTVEVPKSQFKEKASLSPEINSNRATSPSPSRTKKVVETVPRSDDSSKNVTLVISGGDGYEDFRTSATSESVGRDDSTNHLLIWRV